MFFFCYHFIRPWFTFRSSHNNPLKIKQNKKTLWSIFSSSFTASSDWNVLFVVSTGTPVWRLTGGLWGWYGRLEGGVAIDLGDVPVPFVPSHGADVQNTLERKKNKVKRHRYTWQFDYTNYILNSFWMRKDNWSFFLLFGLFHGLGVYEGVRIR